MKCFRQRRRSISFSGGFFPGLCGRCLCLCSRVAPPSPPPPISPTSRGHKDNIYKGEMSQVFLLLFWNYHSSGCAGSGGWHSPATWTPCYLTLLEQIISQSHGSNSLHLAMSTWSSKPSLELRGEKKSKPGLTNQDGTVSGSDPVIF